MDYDLPTILKFCGACLFALCVVGIPMLAVAAKKARREFRVKGYLKIPSGSDWLPFLLRKRYEAFGDPSARFYFTISHICMVGSLIVLGAVVALVSCTVMLRMVSDGPQPSMSALRLK